LVRDREGAGNGSQGKEKNHEKRAGANLPVSSRKHWGKEKGGSRQKERIQGREGKDKRLLPTTKRKKGKKTSTENSYERLNIKKKGRAPEEVKGQEPFEPGKKHLAKRKTKSKKNLGSHIGTESELKKKKKKKNFKRPDKQPAESEGWPWFRQGKNPWESLGDLGKVKRNL